MSVEPVGPVVVGVDGSPGSLAAVDLAAEEAAARVVPLVVVHGYGGPAMSRAASARLLELAAARVGAEHPGLAVDLDPVPGDPADALVMWSREACLLVVGHRGRWEPPAGCVASRVAARARVPVIVHRELDTARAVPQPRPVLVGVTGASDVESVVELGFAEAALRGAPLLAAHVRSRAGAATAGEQAVMETVAGWSEKYPEVRVSWLVRYGLDVPIVLTAASRSAQLVVVGATRRLQGLRPGSVSEVLIQRAGCPVAVVPIGGGGSGARPRHGAAGPMVPDTR
jgi:nucleotide-binding universal stress UspA family protein